VAELWRDRTARRLVVCVLLGVVAGHYAYLTALTRAIPSDLGQVWFAARMVLEGRDPYPLIGPGRAFQWGNGFYYPLPAALLLTPLSFVSQTLAVAIFAALGGFAFAWALTRERWGPLFGFFSLSTAFAFEVCQWSPLFAGAFVIPPLGVLLAAKPTIGAAVFAAKPTRWALVGGVALLALSFALQPHWISQWQASLHETSVGGGSIAYGPPISWPAGFLTLLALLRWKRPEARLLAVLAMVPQTPLPYEGILLFLVPRGWKESLLLTASSWAMLWYVRLVFPLDGLPMRLNAYGHAMVPFLYLPCVIMVLRRPNEGTVPSLAWLTRWPTWRRGSAARTSTG
jgi:hypothetical protein